jgi:hypothetical protein
MAERAKFEISGDVSSGWDRLKWSAKMTMGRLGLNGHADNYREVGRINAHYQKFRDRSRADRLSAEEIKYWSARINKPEHIEDRRIEFQTVPVEKSRHGIVAILIEMLLEHDRSIRSIIEIGVYWGYVIDYLAGQYPDVQFIGVDMPHDLERFNTEFRRQNLSFRSGYALDMLEQEHLSADAIFFNATATRLTTNELKRFLRAIAQKCRYVVFSEPLIHLPGGLVIDPGLVSLDESKPTTLSSEEWPPQYVHNYRGLAEQAGFNTLHYRVYEPEFWRGIHRIDLIGELS